MKNLFNYKNEIATIWRLKIDEKAPINFDSATKLIIMKPYNKEESGR
ncbi:MAG: hypothetical protein LBC09_06645 [Helicobacteraceae bacterium]|jgi:hypothetical protein|nr:hypothetical protein [Helicobacteraceae bacterium]